ncbi:MAG: efflux RND transporter periplasmic adaptor subunit [Bdellovibrionales bacterium]|nr:efflux RND transporter periplasmic adaptor subunit [Bdellovibrionales bacterium]
MKYWIGFLLVAVIGATGYFFYKKRGATVSYRPVDVEQGTIEVKILTSGTVQPKNRLEIKPPIAGRVEDVLVVEGQAVRKGQILAWMSSTERAAMLDAARAQGAAEVRRWEDMYRPTPVISPIHGTVILRSVEPGQTFTNADAIMVLSDKLTVKAQVDETDMAQVKLKQRAVIVLDAYAKEKIEGHVDQIAFEAKTTNNVTTYQVDVVPDQTPDFMRSGMTANVTFLLEVKENIPTLPVDVIDTSAKTPKVLVPGTDGQPLEKDIETGISDGKKIEIVSGLNTGDRVLAIVQESSEKSKNSNPFSPQRMGGRRKK